MNVDEIWAIAPCIALGILCGIGKYLQNFIHDENYKPSIRRFLANSVTSAILSFIIFALLESFKLDFMTRLAIACSVAFFGPDKFLEILQKLVNLKDGIKKE